METKPECVPCQVHRVPGYEYLPERGEIVRDPRNAFFEGA